MEPTEPDLRCSIGTFHSSDCGPYSRYPQEKTIVKLLSCRKDISNHLRTLKLAVGGVGGLAIKSPVDLGSEADLLCRRVGLFTTNSFLTVCPFHRYKLGIDFRQVKKCTYPDHTGKGKIFRGVSSTHSQHILEEYGVLLPVGTGVCYECYLKLPKQDCMNEENLQSFSQELSVAESTEDDGQFYKFGKQHVLKNAVTLQPRDKGATCFENSQSCTNDAVVDSDFQSINTSSSQPLSQISSWSEENIDTVLTDLNDAIDVLGHGQISPIKYRVRRDLDLLQPSSLRTVKRKAGETINLFLDAIAPGQSTKLLKILQEPDSKDDTGNLHEVVLNLYMESSDRSLKKQLLSMIAHSHTKSELKQLIPGVTVHAIDEARKHATMIGAGMGVPSKEPAKRQKMDREKLDHALDFFFDPTFHQITAFGTKEMKLSSGTLLTIPNVVRTAYHSTLVETYLSYCSETSFDPLCNSSLFKILSECPASRRTNLKGLDNIAADGNSAYDTLMDVIGVLENQSIGRSNAILKECKEKLQSSKLYIKTEYKLHLERESRCPDHCINFGLSDITNRNLTNQCCNHDHDMTCDRCNAFDEAISMLRSFVLGNDDLSIEKQRELEHDLSTSESAVFDWKCHIVRLVAQDSCRKEKLLNLKNGEVMVVMDWAMKFLPLLFREKQSDWFGQKGLNWHVTVCVFKDYENQLKHRTYVHVMDGVKQDWYSVACMLQHVLLALKKQQPTVTTAFLRSDNAGCYHCSNLWHAVPAISEETGVNIQRYDFSESQDGKSYCDAKIAHMRAKLRKYVSNGGNISCSADMKKALDDGEGVPGCQIAHVDIPLPVDQLTLQRKIKGITKISNVQFENWCQLKYWKNYNIGEGQTLSITPINLESTLNVLSDFKVPCKDTGNILAAREKQPSEESQSDVNLTCPEHNCNAVLHSYSELNDHCFVGDHHYMSTFDGIKMKWRDICLDIDTTSSKTKHSTLSAGTSELSLGWALKKDRKNHRFSEKVKVYLKGVFDEGESSGNKANPVNVSRNMRVCHDGDGMKMFTPKEYLQPSQITSYLSRLVVLSRAPATDVVEDDIDSTIAIINQAEALEELVNIFV